MLHGRCKNKTKTANFQYQWMQQFVWNNRHKNLSGLRTAVTWRKNCSCGWFYCQCPGSHIFVCLCMCLWLCLYLCVWSRVCSWRVLAGTVRKCALLSLYPRSSMTACRWSGCVPARWISLKHAQSISALSIRRVLDVAYLARRDTQPTLF